MISKYIHKGPRDMKQLLVKLSDEDYAALEEYCRRTGRTKSAVIRHQISRLRLGAGPRLLKRRIERISSGKGRLVSDLIREMRS